MVCQKIKFRFSAVAIIALSAIGGGYCEILAQDQSVTLDAVKVTGTGEEDVKDKKVGEIKKDAKMLEHQQVSDTRDMVKYETGVSVVESGRFGASGYSIRGVDENRVAIQIDGLRQAETISSQGFKELFEGYGNFNNTRNGIEIENVKQVNITKGADSIKAGSGALGGSVMFDTKDARDYLIDKDWHYGFKVGHSTANDERMHSHTLAARVKMFDFLVVKTDRNGHETKNYGYGEYDDSVRGRDREKADPYHIIKDGTLIKLGFQPHEEHRFSFTNDVYKAKYKGSDYSYTLYPPSSGSGFQFTPKLGGRYTDDLSERKNKSFTYENFTQTPFWDSMKITYSHQKITQRARTEERCLDGDKCADVANPIFKRDANKNIVDSNGKTFDIKDSPSGPKLFDSNGKEYESNVYSLKPIKEYRLNCEEFNCDKELTLYRNKDVVGMDQTEKMTLPLNQPTYEFTGKNGKKYKFEISTEEYNGKKYKIIKPFHTYTGGWGNQVTNEVNNFSMLLPNSKGYFEVDWKERDLNTEIKQLNFDFEKEFLVFGLENNLKYGLARARTEKSMVNKTGYYGKDPKWWADTYKPDCGKNGKDVGNALKCPRTDPKTSFLIPVKSKEGLLYATDKLRVNDYVEFDLGYRYDKIKYKPNYILGVTPKIADDMVKGLFVPLPPKKQTKNNPREPQFGDPDIGWDFNKLTKEHEAWEKEKEEIAEYNKKVKEYNDKLEPQNAIDNIRYLSRPKDFSNDSYAVGVNLDPLEFLRVQTKYSKAFRAPTSDELYMTFKHPDMTIVPNPSLKPEIAKTKEIAFTVHNNSSFLTLSKFRSDYKDFIDFAFKGRKQFNVTGTNQDSALDFDIYQNVNRQSAVVNGIEINSRLNLGDIKQKLGGIYLGYKFTKQSGKIQTQTDGRVPMNAIQPKKSVYTIGYVTPSNKYGADIYVTAVEAKSPKDTYNMFWRDEKKNGNPINGKKVTDYSSHWLSTKYKTIDVVAFAKPIKNLTFRFGAYNITDQKYLTWESARSIRSFGTMNMVRKSDSLGINRFYSPGRNFKLTFEMTF
ncbi:MAG: TonB-dependent hemoglobin/transferrin/lactoferrin family receptor [Campylobacter sp.]